MLRGRLPHDGWLSSPGHRALRCVRGSTLADGDRPDPDEAEKLTLASTEGKIQLALRNPLDKSTPATHGIRSAGLLGAVATTPRPTARLAVDRPAPAPAAAEPATVEIIRGDKRVREIVRQE